MELGFCELYDEKNDKGLSQFFKVANNKDVLGLRALNVKFSDVLFPECSTLMPNLVYIYYLNAIYHVLKEKRGAEWNLKKERSAIDRFEKLISQNIEESDGTRKKGFMKEAQERAFSKYYNKMEMLHYWETDWRSSAEMKKTHQDILKETPRYELIQNIIGRIQALEKKDANIEVQQNIVKEEFTKYNGEILYKLDGYERMDYIRRVLQPVSEKGIMRYRYSYFSNVVMDYLYYKRVIPSGKLYLDKYNNFFAYKKENIVKEEMPVIFEEIQYGQDIEGKKNQEEGRSMIQIYIEAKDYSALQYIAKLVFNKILFRNQSEKAENYEEKLKDHISKYREVNLAIWGNKKTIKNYCKNQEVLGSAYGFIENVKTYVLEYKKACSNKDESKQREAMQALDRLVIEREKVIMGDESLLESGIRASDEIGMYIDTFRWEYRPKDEKNRDPEPMCASFYIYELFCEKLNEEK